MHRRSSDMEQILHQLSLLSDKDRRHVEKELERERRHYEKEQRRAERHRRREEKRRRRSERRARARHSSSSSSSESESSDDERRYRPSQGLAYTLRALGPGTSGSPFLPASAQGQPAFPPPPGTPSLSGMALPSTPSTIRSGASPNPQSVAPPPSYTPLAHHVQVPSGTAFPGQLISGRPVAADVNGQAVYLGLVHLHGGLHPCKVIPHYDNPVYVGWAGAEHAPSGPYILVPFDDARMHWVHTRDGQVPPGVRPVNGGYEGDGQPLFHALCFVHGTWVPGKTGYHLEGANAPFGNLEHHAREYHLLCWK